MKTLFKHFLILLAFLSLFVSCSSDDDFSDDFPDPTAVTSKILKIELVPKMANPEDYNNVNILLTVNSSNDNLDIIGEEYIEKSTYDETKRIFEYLQPTTAETLNFLTTDKVFGPGITIHVTAKENSTIKTLVYTIKVYADNNLVKTEDLYLEEGNISQIFSPIINWDYLK